MSVRFVGALALALPLLLPFAAGAQNAAVTNPLARLDPGLLQKAPPEWVVPGTRIAWWSGMVTIDETREAIYVEDPRGPFYDVEGNRYRLERPAGKTGGSSGDNAGGHGYTQIDIVAVTEKSAVISCRYLVMDDVNVAPVLFLVTGGKVDRATGGGLWGNPGGLAAVRHVEGVKILRGPYEVGGNRYDSIVFAGDDAGRVYDLASGLIISERITGESQRGWVKRNHVYYPAPPRVSGALLQIVGTRRYQVPWAGADAPEWLKTTTTLRYRGGTTIEMPGSGTMTIPSTTTVTKKESGADWALFDVLWVQPPYGPQPEQRAEVVHASGASMIGGYFIAPGKLAELEPGQRIDRDSLAQSETLVAGVGPAPDGRTIVTIAERAARYTVEWTYDRESGILLASRVIQPGPLQTTTVWMRLAGTE